MLELIVKTDIQESIPSMIDFNFDELKAELGERLEYYNGLVVTEDGIKEAKEDRAKLNKLRTAIDTRRKDIKKDYLKPYNDFEAKIKELTQLIDQPIAAIDEQLNIYEDQRKEAKLEAVRELYEENINPTIEDIIPLDRILDQKWLNVTVTMKAIEEALQDWNKRVNADLLALDTIEPEYKAAVREKYIATLDVAKAIAHRDDLKAAEEAFKAREEEKKAREEERKAKEEEQARKEVEKATEAKTEPREEPREEEKPHRQIIRLEFRLTHEQAIALKQFIDLNGIEYNKI